MKDYLIDMKKLIFMKIGGSILTDKTSQFSAEMETIKRIAKEIHEIRKEGNIQIIVGHGGGSFPHVPAKKYRTNEGVINKDSYRGIAEVQDAASRLNRIFVGELIAAGENAISVQPSASSIGKNGKIINWYVEPIFEMLKHDLLPVPYGDVVLDLEKGCMIASTEEIFDHLSKQLKPDRIIIVGKPEGVFTGDPNINPDAELIPEISPRNFNEIKKYLGGSHGTDVTGGMLDKVEKMLELAEKEGYETQIIGGLTPGNIAKALKGEKVGTIIRGE